MRSDTTLTIRCIAAFGVLGLVMIVSYVFVSQSIEQSEKNAGLINTAGMQRMLSQRITLNALRATTETDYETNRAIELLRSSIAKMRSNHDALLRQTTAQRFHAKYPEAVLEQQALNDDVEAFLLAAGNLNSSLADGATAARLQMQEQALQQQLDAGLLGELDAYVMTLQKIDEAETSRFVQLQAICLLIGLATLVTAGVFVFIPITSGISKALDRLETADSELRQFSYTISNDLRQTAVSTLSIVNHTQESLENKDAAGAKALLKKAARGLKNIDNQVSDIVEITKSRQSEPSFEQFRLRPIVESVFGRLGRLPDSKSMLLRNNVPADTVVMNSKVHIEQIIENLVSNAIKYSDKDKSTRFVEVGVEDIGDSQRITVIDNGIGIAAENRDTMFQMFKRYHPDVAVGAGLGLYLVKQSATRVGGDITYSPTPSGSRFMLKLAKTPRAA